MMNETKMVQKEKHVLSEKIRMIIFVIILGTISAGLIVVINSLTADKVFANDALKIKSGVLISFDIDFQKSEIEKVFDENIKVIEKGESEFYQTESGEIAFEIAGPGFWGPITGILALNPELKSIKGISILHQEETPGLGSRISEKDFLVLFKNKKIKPKISIVTGKISTGDNEIDAITGATMTSDAFEDILNNEISKNIEIWEGKHE